MAAGSPRFPACPEFSPMGHLPKRLAHGSKPWHCESSLTVSSTAHRVLARNGWPDVIFAFHDGEEIGPRMLARLAKHTGLQPGDL